MCNNRLKVTNRSLASGNIIFYKNCNKCGRKKVIEYKCLEKLVPRNKWNGENKSLSIEQWNSAEVDFQCFNCKNNNTHTDEEEESDEDKETDDDEERDKVNPNILHHNKCGFCGKHFKTKKINKEHFHSNCHVCTRNFRLHDSCITTLLPNRSVINNPMTSDKWQNTKSDLYCNVCKVDCFWCKVNHSTLKKVVRTLTGGHPPI